MIDNTPLLLETIKSEEGKVFNLDYHQQRCDFSRLKLLGTQDKLDLSAAIYPPHKGLYRCRILYDTKIRSIEYIPYAPKKISTIKIISSNLEYVFKYAQRETLDTLLHTHADADEIIIEKDGYLTDTTIANIALYDGEKWITPSRPLLQGTMRAKLIDDGFLTLKQIKTEELSQYTQVALMNAMLGFKILTDISIQDTKGTIYDY